MPFYDLLEWWDKVVKYKKVNLYSGFGLYSAVATSSYSWYHNPYEAYNQTMICNTFKNVKGIAVFDSPSIKKSITDDSHFKGMKELWDTPKILPEIKNYDKVVPDKIENFTAVKNSAGNLLSWDRIDNAKFYIIYRSEKEITYKPDEVIDIIGNLENGGKIDYTDINVRDDVTNQKGTIGVLSDLVIPSGIIPGVNSYVYWDKVTYPFGDEIKYQCFYSINNEEEVEIKKIDNVNGMCRISIKIPENTEKVKITVKAYNNIGESIRVYEKKISELIGEIQGFEYLGENYTNSKANFSWKLLNLEDVNYVLQYSYDKIVWTSLDNEVMKNDYFAKISTLFINKVGKVYYRVVGIIEDGYAFSEILEVDLKNKLDAFNNLIINNEEFKNYYIIKEGDYINITFDKLSNNKVEYDVYFSSDYKTWIKGKLYDKNFTIEIIDNKVSIKFSIQFYPLMMYSKIIVSESNNYGETEVFMLYVGALENYLYDVVDSFSAQMESFLIKSYIYK